MELSRSKLLFCLTVIFLAPLRSEGSKKVPVDLYYETLCPYCSNFIVNQLHQLFSNGLIDVVDLHLVPYGNARILANGTIECQHGPYECFLNAVEACAIDIWPDVV
ncbi:GILT-like protein [Nymphaea thermarum]|nr:GILT-like protein [Nymphaea thermarum]